MWFSRLDNFDIIKDHIGLWKVACPYAAWALGGGEVVFTHYDDVLSGHKSKQQLLDLKMFKEIKSFIENDKLTMVVHRIPLTLIQSLKDDPIESLNIQLYHNLSLLMWCFFLATYPELWNQKKVLARMSNEPSVISNNSTRKISLLVKEFGDSLLDFKKFCEQFYKMSRRRNHKDHPTSRWHTSPLQKDDYFVIAMLPIYHKDHPRYFPEPILVLGKYATFQWFKDQSEKLRKIFVGRANIAWENIDEIYPTDFFVPASSYDFGVLGW